MTCQQRLTDCYLTIETETTTVRLKAENVWDEAIQVKQQLTFVGQEMLKTPVVPPKKTIVVWHYFLAKVTYQVYS